MKKLFLLDGHALIYRAYFAFMRRPMVNSKGLDTSAIFGFTKTLIDLILKDKPSHLAVGFDPGGLTFRHEAYPLYKANRDATPDVIKASLPVVKQILEAFHIPVYMKEGFEADDVLGTMAKEAEKEGFTVYLVTPDKDYGQLVSPNIYQYKPGRSGEEREILGPQEICAKYGIDSPEQVIDILAIWGDASDNVPGVPGIGEVGAKKLISKYKSVEQVLQHLSELPEKQRKSIQENEQQLKQSKELVTIHTSVPFSWDSEDIRIAAPNLSEVEQLFREYEFTSLRSGIAALRQFFCPSLANNMENDMEDMPEFFPVPQPSYSIKHGAPVFTRPPLALSLAAIYTNTGPMAVQLSALALCTDKEQVHYLACPNAGALKQHVQFLKPCLENPGTMLIGHNLKPFLHLLLQEGIRLKNSIQDTELMHYLINPERSHKIEVLAKTYLNFEWPEASQSTPKQASLFDTIDPSVVSEAQITQLCASTYAAFALQPMLAQELQKEEVSALYTDLEAPLSNALAHMEEEGIRLDVPRLRSYGHTCAQELAQIATQIRELSQAPELNISSPKQLGIILFEKLKLAHPGKVVAGKQYSTDEETLMTLYGQHPIIELILEYRSLSKLISSYIEPLPALVNPATGHIHTTFNQSLAATGRLSAQKPNMQNIPIRDNRGKELRRVFVPRNSDYLLLSADYSQIELRLMAHLSQDPLFIRAFKNEEDIHIATAAKIFHCTPEEVTKEQRNRAKTANFGIIYGISAFGLSQRLQLPRAESKALIENYFNLYPKVKEYIETQIEIARRLGYVTTILQRRRYLPEINTKNMALRGLAERNAVNAPIQGSAADIIKIAMVRIAQKMETLKLRSRMILQVHDELVFDLYRPEQESLIQLVKQEMEHAVALEVPLSIEYGIGENWLEAH